MISCGVVGATGLVGETIIKVLQDRSFPSVSFHPFASDRSEGKIVRYRNIEYPVEIIRPESINRGMILFGATSANIAKNWVPMCIAEGALVIDNSSAYRMNPDVLLAVPEVNGHLITGNENIIANPNCSTIQLVVALNPLAQLGTIEWISVSTYQAVSGAGTPALEELKKQQNGTLTANAAGRIHENVITSIGLPDKGGYCSEEVKLMNETCKIMGMDFPVFASTARVPVRTGHTEAVVVKFASPVQRDEAVRILEESPGVTVSESGSSPLTVENTDIVIVDRIRNNPGDPSVLQFWVLADNLRKGAALNAVQIAEKFILNRKK
ncbi:MAG: aspartate-semialdehyde dehydrogenase [Candidatus Fermentibacteria bacterium]